MSVVSTDTPIVVSILDGSTLNLFLEDEDDFAMLAENLFTDLDEEDIGKLCKSQIRKALAHMGVEMGVPPLSGLFFLAPSCSSGCAQFCCPLKSHHAHWCFNL